MTSERGVRRSLTKSVSRDVTTPNSLLPGCPSSVTQTPLTSLLACHARVDRSYLHQSVLLECGEKSAQIFFSKRARHASKGRDHTFRPSKSAMVL